MFPKEFFTGVRIFFCHELKSRCHQVPVGLTFESAKFSEVVVNLLDATVDVVVVVFVVVVAAVVAAVAVVVVCLSRMIMAVNFGITSDTVEGVEVDVRDLPEGQLGLGLVLRPQKASEDKMKNCRK